MLGIFLLPLGAARTRGQTANAADPDRENYSVPAQGGEDGFDKDKDWDDAVAREKWLRRGHKSPDDKPSAWHHHQAELQAKSLPVLIPHYSAPPVASPAGTFSAMSVPPPSAPPTFNSSCDWTPIGPMPLSITGPYGFTSGLVDTVAVDTANDPTGNTMYLGACRGGVWKTTNGLSASPTYTLLSDPHQTLSVGAIGLDTSANPPILYVGTGDYNGDDWFGQGIFKSTDDGATWTLTSTADSGAISLYGMTFSKILVDPVNPAVVLAGTSDNGGGDPGGPFPTRFGIYRSTDSGATWTKITTVTSGTALGNSGCQDLAYDASTAAYYAAVNGKGVYKSVNQGASWAQTTTPFPSGTAVSASNFTRACVAARGGKVWCLVVAGNALSTPVTATDTGLSESDDGGATWTPVSLADTVASGNEWYQAGYDLYVAAPPGSTSLVLGNIDVWSGVPNGMATHWTNTTNTFNNGIVHCDQHAIAFAGANTWYVGNDGGVWDTTDAGTSWHDGNTNLDTVLFYHVSADPNNTGYFLGGAQDNGTSATKNQGVTWFEIAGSDGNCTGATPGTPGQYFAEYYNVSLLISANYGRTWPNGVGNPPITDPSAFFVPFKVVPSSPASVILGTTRVWEGPANTSGGTGWNPISPSFTGNDITALDVAPSNPNVIYAVTADPQVDVTTNGGGSWTNVTAGLLPKLWWIVNCIAVDPTNPATAYIAFQQITNSSAGHVYATNNTGATWTDIGGNLPDAPVNWVLVDPEVPNDVYVATDVGVFVTQAVNGSGTVWSQLGTQLPDTTIETLDISRTCPRVIVAGTYGRSAWSICPVDTGSCATNTPTSTPNAASMTPTPFPTLTRTSSPTDTATPSPTYTATSSPTSTGTSSATATPSSTATRTATPTPSPSLTSTATPTLSSTSSATSSPTASGTATPSPTGTFTPTASPTTALTPTDSATPSPSRTATSSPTITASFTPSSTPSPTGTLSPTRTDTRTLTPTFTATDSPTATRTPPPTPTLTVTPTPTSTAATVTAAQGAGAPGNSTQLPGAMNVPSGQVVFTNPGNAAVTLTQVTVSVGGNGNPNGVGAVGLSENGTPAGSVSLSGGAALFNVNRVLSPGQSVTFEVTGGYGGSAQGTYQWSVTGAAGTNGQAVAFSGLPVAGATVTVAQATATPTSTPLLPTPTLTPTSTPSGQAAVVVFPNPATGTGPVTVQVTLASPADRVDILVYTTAFRRVNDIALTNLPGGVTDTALPLTDRWGEPLANGLYYIVVHAPQSLPAMKLLVLR